MLLFHSKEKGGDGSLCSSGIMILEGEKKSLAGE